MTRTLYVVPTPLGNLEDITLRAIRVLGEVALIAAEDTRHSRILLNHHHISTPLISYHQHSKLSRIPRLLEKLAEHDVALISDAGMPSLSDPGFELIAAAVGAGFNVDVLPGPSAITTAFVLAAIPARGFVYMGFLPRTKKDIVTRLNEVGSLPYALVIFESARRLVSTLSAITEVLGEREAVAAKELSKLHQQAVRGSLSDVQEVLCQAPPRGEWTLVVGPQSESALDSYQSDSVVDRLLSVLVDRGDSPRDAVRRTSEILGMPRSRVYRSSLMAPPSDAINDE